MGCRGDSVKSFVLYTDLMTIFSVYDLSQHPISDIRTHQKNGTTKHKPTSRFQTVYFADDFAFRLQRPSSSVVFVIEFTPGTLYEIEVTIPC